MQRRRNGPGLFATECPHNDPPSLNSITFDPQQNMVTHNLYWDAKEKGAKHVTEPVHEDENLVNSVPHPNLKDLMVADEDYLQFSLVDSSQQRVGCGGIDYESQVMCARICTGFSFVAILFLVFVGVLIHKQPLYIKGINLQKQEQYGMHVASKNAFKTAAAYFLVMVLSMIYAQNHERFNWNTCKKITNAIRLRQHFAVAYSSYRRREYNNIPEDVNSVAPDLPTFEDILNLGRENAGVEEENTPEDQIPSFELWKTKRR